LLLYLPHIYKLKKCALSGYGFSAEINWIWRNNTIQISINFVNAINQEYLIEGSSLESYLHIG
jgi:hypothetical protein